ncbi:MAG: hypothetical protein HY554_02595 [Elusimicrobia bacterium]|nr:hypothetical protein [Elusimicrobiota bacterium]
MNRALWVVVALLAAGCKKPVSSAVQDARQGNTAPAQHAEELRNDIEKAKGAAAKANEAIGATNSSLEAAESGQ